MWGYLSGPLPPWSNAVSTTGSPISTDTRRELPRSPERDQRRLHLYPLDEVHGSIDRCPVCGVMDGVGVGLRDGTGQALVVLAWAAFQARGVRAAKSVNAGTQARAITSRR